SQEVDFLSHPRGTVFLLYLVVYTTKYEITRLAGTKHRLPGRRVYASVPQSPDDSVQAAGTEPDGGAIFHIGSSVVQGWNQSTGNQRTARSRQDNYRSCAQHHGKEPTSSKNDRSARYTGKARKPYR